MKLKKVLLMLCLFALLVSACAAPLPGSKAPSSPDSAQGAAAGTLRFLCGSEIPAAEDNLYFIDWKEDGRRLATRFNSTNNEEYVLCTEQNCAHTGADCAALLPGTSDADCLGRFFADGGQLYWCMEYNSTGQQAWFVSQPDGTQKQPLWTLTTAGCYYDGWCADDNAFYVLRVSMWDGANTGVASQTHLMRVDKATGLQTELYAFAPGAYVRMQGVTQDEFVLVVRGALDNTIVCLNRSTLQSRTVYSFTDTQNSIYPQVAQNVCLLLDYQNVSVTKIDLATGAASPVPLALPPDANRVTPIKDFPIDGRVLFTADSFDGGQYTSENAKNYVYDAASDTVTELTLQYSHCGEARPMYPLAVFTQQYLVVMDEQVYTMQDIGTDGIPYTHDTTRFLLALINKEDFWANKAAFTEANTALGFN